MCGVRRSTVRDKAGAARVNIVRGAPWKDALISVLQPESPYQPWQPAGGLKAGEAVIAVLDTDPVSVLAGVGRVGADGDAGRALAGIDPFRRTGLIELGTLNMLADFVVRADDSAVFHHNSPADVVAVIGAYMRSTPEALTGHTSLAQGRILLDSRGTCTGCRQPIDLTGPDARDRVHIHTVTPLQPRKPLPRNAEWVRDGWRTPRSFPADWPAVLCDSCHDAMQAGGFSGFLDFKFSVHPRCPVCSAQCTLSAMFGMPAGPVEEPWIATMGCCVEPIEWCCASCDYQW